MSERSAASYGRRSGSSNAAVVPELHIEFDKKDFKRIIELQKKFGKEGNKFIKRSLRGETAKIKREVAKTAYGQRGPHSLGKGPGADAKLAGGGYANYGHLRKNALQGKASFKGVAKIGWYIRINFKKPGPTSKAYVGWIHEGGTKRGIPAKQPLETAYKKYDKSRFVDVTNKAIEHAIKKAIK